MTVLDVSGLTVALADRRTEIVRDVSFTVDAGTVLGVVGESGSGKTTLALAVLGHCRPGTTVLSGHVVLGGTAMFGLSPRGLRARRGREVAYVAQDPAAALNPALRIGTQLSELLDVHAAGLDREDRTRQLAAVLADVRLPDTSEFLRRYPHQLSGGEQQRVAIAMAALLRPRVIVMDEPTTGLDVTTQAHTLRTVRRLCDEHGVAVLYVTHDLAVVREIADRTIVMYSGRVVELGDDVLRRPVHPYTRGLMNAIPSITEARALTAIPDGVPAPGQRPAGCAFSSRCAHVVDRCTEAEPTLASFTPGHLVRCFRAGELGHAALPVSLREPRRGTAQPALLTVRGLTASYGDRQVVHGIDMEVLPGECVALVGGSGSGKTTISRSIVGLTAQWHGEVRFRGTRVRQAARDRPRQLRRAVQYIFQNPYGSLNPRRTVGESVGVPLRHFSGVRGRELRARVATVLEEVMLPKGKADQYPDQLSGGERQRAAIARALVCRPEILICDEITSALDVSVQAAIVELLDGLRRDGGLSLIFVTHNLALVHSVADRVLVLDRGRIVESGTAAAVLTHPVDGYTRVLLRDTPSLDRDLDAPTSTGSTE